MYTKRIMNTKFPNSKYACFDQNHKRNNESTVKQIQFVHAYSIIDHKFICSYYVQKEIYVYQKESAKDQQVHNWKYHETSIRLCWRDPARYSKNTSFQNIKLWRTNSISHATTKLQKSLWSMKKTCWKTSLQHYLSPNNLKVHEILTLDPNWSKKYNFEFRYTSAKEYESTMHKLTY